MGKSCILSRLMNNAFNNEHNVTIGVEFGNYVMRIDNQHIIQLQIWDTAGHEDLGRLRPIAYTNTDCFLVCFSLVDKNSLKQACTKWIAEVKATAKSCPCILVGTKMDLRDEREQENDPAKMKDVVTSAELKQYAS